VYMLGVLLTLTGTALALNVLLTKRFGRSRHSSEVNDTYVEDTSARNYGLSDRNDNKPQLTDKRNADSRRTLSNEGATAADFDGFRGGTG
jgi:hypothetical protein